MPKMVAVQTTACYPIVDAFEKGLQEGDVVKVGLNKYVDDHETNPDVDLHEYNEAWAERQIERLESLKLSRDNGAVKTALEALRKKAETQENVMPVLVECCRLYATVGEMTSVFRDVFGEWQEPGIF